MYNAASKPLAKRSKVPLAPMLDPTLSARILSRKTLHYEHGADAALDRPAHVRAASAIARYRDQLAIIQDDASFIALLDPRTDRIRDIPLPRGPGGARLFDKGRGNKQHKLDLESCFVVERPQGPMLIALGSGSSSARETIVLGEQLESTPVIHTLRLPRLYAALRAHPSFLRNELNLEGALLIDQHVRLFQRSNGTSLSKLPASCASCDLSWPVFAALLEAPESAPVPALENVRHYALGEIAGTRLTFTDATPLTAQRTLFLASAEASPDAIEDGEVHGTALGVLQSDASVRMCLLLDEQGEPCRDKAEGLCLSPENPAELLVVFDPDDPDRPAELARVRMAGPW
jgi:hypothetical protein